MVSVCLPSDALSHHLPSYLGFSYLGRGLCLHGCSSKAQPLLHTLDEGYLLTQQPLLPFLPKGLSNLLQHHSSKTSILWCSVFFMVQFSHPCMTTGKAVLTIRTFVGKVKFLPFNTLSRFIIAFLPKSKCLLISWLQ